MISVSTREKMLARYIPHSDTWFSPVRPSPAGGARRTNVRFPPGLPLASRNVNITTPPHPRSRSTRSEGSLRAASSTIVLPVPRNMYSRHYLYNTTTLQVLSTCIYIMHLLRYGLHSPQHFKPGPSHIYGAQHLAVGRDALATVQMPLSTNVHPEQNGSDNCYNRITALNPPQEP